MSEGSAGTTTASGGSDPLEWQFLQCFGERTPGEEIQEGQACCVQTAPDKCKAAVKGFPPDQNAEMFVSCISLP